VATKLEPVKEKKKVKALGVPVKSTCRRTDLNIRRRVPTIREATTKIITIRRVRDRKVVIKKEDNRTIRNMEWVNLKIKEPLISPTSSPINKTCSKWINLRSKSYLLMCSLCMETISLPLVVHRTKEGLKTLLTRSMVYNR
jgi:hypothetical protein